MSNRPLSQSDEEQAIRRVRSTGDIPDPDHHPPRSPRSRRSEGQSTPVASSSRLAVPTPLPLQYPEPAEIRDFRPRSPPITWNLNTSLGATQEERRQHQIQQLQQQQQRLDANVEDAATPIIERTDFVGRVLTFFGYAGPNAKERKELVGLIWNLTFGFAQFVIIITMLVIAGVRRSPDPAHSNSTEWDACDKPLGAWNCIWLARVVLGGIVTYWGFKRERIQRIAQERRESGENNMSMRDVELGRSSHGHTGLPPPSTGGRPSRASSRVNSPPGSPDSTVGPTPPLPHSYLYSRLSLLTSVLSLVWFLTAHILEYTSVNTCRFAAPHLWWLTFGILCILYLMILEIFLLGLLVFILGPVIYLAYSLILFCIGRHPIQNPPIKPEIGKLSQAVVDEIPLVLYIPAPPDEDEKSAPLGEDEDSDKMNTGLVKDGEGMDEAFSYPPKPSSTTKKNSTPTSAQKKGNAKPKKRFAFLRIGRKSRKGDGSSKGKGGRGGRGDGDDDEGERNWEDDWEKGEYPFVRMEGHRATCAICLMDFDEPPRVASGRGGSGVGKGKGKGVAGEGKEAAAAKGGRGEDERRGEGGVEEVPVEEMEIEEAERRRVQLEDAGEGPQPLRLLSCGHAFHKTCIDPWLTGMSGRCPTCQRPIEVPQKTGKKKSRRRTGNGGS